MLRVSQTFSYNKLAVYFFIIALEFCLLMMPLSLFSQSLMFENIEEKHPTTRDPRYIPPQIPEHLRENAPAGAMQGEAEMLFSPTGGLDGSISDRDRADEIKQKRTDNRMPEMKGDYMLQYEWGERAILEESMQREFGVNLSAMNRGRWQQEHYKESAYRRFEIIYFMALPFTMALSYGAAYYANGTSRSFNHSRTIAYTGTGLLLAGGVAWYDHVRWREFHLKKSEDEKKLKQNDNRSSFNSQPPMERRDSDMMEAMTTNRSFSHSQEGKNFPLMFGVKISF